MTVLLFVCPECKAQIKAYGFSIVNGEAYILAECKDCNIETHHSIEVMVAQLLMDMIPLRAGKPN